jgi:hypothetical protein
LRNERGPVSQATKDQMTYKIVNAAGETLEKFQSRETSEYELTDLAEKILGRELQTGERVTECDINGN